MEINQKVAVVAGGASGLGAATVHHLARLGAKVVVLDSNLDKANSLAKKVQGMALSCDVTRDDEVTAAFEEFTQAIGPARICVNCAGIAPGKRIVSRSGVMPLEEFSRVIEVNLIGSFNIMRMAAYWMSTLDPLGNSGEKGVIINTASVAAYEGQIGQAAYSASKAGIVGMTLPAARELAAQGIRVMTIAPGIMNTPMVAGMSVEVQKSLESAIPFPKRLGEPDEYAKLVAHIIENEYLNGSVIRLDASIRLSAK